MAANESSGIVGPPDSMQVYPHLDPRLMPAQWFSLSEFHQGSYRKLGGTAPGELDPLSAHRRGIRGGLDEYLTQLAESLAKMWSARWTARRARRVTGRVARWVAGGRDD